MGGGFQKRWRMFERISKGWSLTKQSWHVLMLDKELLFFPLISGLACILVLISFAVPLYNTPYFQTVMDEGGQVAQDPIAWVILFAFYFVNYFVIVFFNTALIACSIIRFRGGDPTVMDGLSASMNRLPQIFAWALVSATVGILLRAIESYSEKAGAFAAAILGGAWSIATYFVVPVLVVEKVGPIDAVKRSFAVLRKTWGESLSANFGIGIITFFFVLLAMAPIIIGVVAMSSGWTVAGIISIVCGVLAVILVSLISSALSSICLGALYLYASDGEVPQQFDRQELAGAFVQGKA
jgi:hypothetical protein